MPTARSEIKAAVVDGRIYVAGGLDAGGRPLDAFEVYDPASDTWQAAASLPVALHHMAVAAAGRQVYVTGGYDSAGFTPDVSGGWVYDPATDTWSSIADMPAPRAAHEMVSIDGKLYVVGGVGSDSTALWVYDPATDTWDTSRTPLPTAREHLSAAAVDGRLYVIGGRWSGSGNLSTVEVYDPATDTWSAGQDMPTPRGGLTAAAVGSQIHVTGGEAFSPSRTFGEHEIYDVATDSWSTMADLPTPRHGLASAAFGGRWYVIGGGTEAGLSVSDVVEIFAAESPPLPTPAPSSGQITGQVWEDLNGDGHFERNEPPLTGVRLNLAEGACREFARFMDATASDRGGVFQFDVVRTGSPTVSVVAMTPGRFEMTTPDCQTVTFEQSDSEPRSVDFGARRLWDRPVRANFLLGEETGDAIWAGVSDPELVERLEGYEEGQGWWYCGRVAPDPLLEWGFSFDPATSFLGEVTAEAQQTTIRFIAADPVFFAESPLPAWCIRVYDVRGRLAGPRAATAYLPYLAR